MKKLVTVSLSVLATGLLGSYVLSQQPQAIGPNGPLPERSAGPETPAMQEAWAKMHAHAEEKSAADRKA